MSIKGKLVTMASSPRMSVTRPTLTQLCSFKIQNPAHDVLELHKSLMLRLKNCERASRVFCSVREAKLANSRRRFFLLAWREIEEDMVVVV